MKAKSLHFSKTGAAQQIAAEFGRIFECVCDKIPPAYPCENEKIVFIGVEMSGRLEKPVEAFCKDLKPVRVKNVAFYVINGKGDVSGLEEISKTLEANGVHVAAEPYGIAVKSGLFKKASVTDADIQAAVAWAKEIIDNKLAK